MEKTIDIIKKQRKVTDALKAHVKEYNKSRKAILNALKEGPKTIPQIAEISGLPSESVTYHLMTLRKFGQVETGEPDDMDEYFYYQLTDKK